MLHDCRNNIAYLMYAGYFYVQVYLPENHPHYP